MGFQKIYGNQEQESASYEKTNPITNPVHPSLCGSYMTEEDEFKLLKEACLSEGGKLLLQDIITSKEATDTIKVAPLVDNGVVVCSQTDQMLKQQGYVAALEWVIGIMQHYRDNQYEESVPYED
jgi:hypothetical protein